MRTFIYRLRAKLEADPRHPEVIVTGWAHPRHLFTSTSGTRDENGAPIGACALDPSRNARGQPLVRPPAQVRTPARGSRNVDDRLCTEL